ncbi:sporulation integral membrane protein YtvI [Ferdinandcohnia quinoae]|nr:sporulation integral membrane protein YtvI [Fredinandcohnia sp. SECRCQ15]
MIKKYINKKTILLLIALIVLIYLIPLSIPLILAFLTALMLDPIVNFLVKNYKFKRIYSVTVTFFVFLIFLLLIGYLIVTVIINQLIMFIKNIPFYVSGLNTEKIQTLLEKWEKYSKDLPIEVIDSIENTLYSLKDLLIVFAKNITEGTFGIVSSIPEFLLELIVYLVAAFLFLNEVPKIKSRIKEMLHESTIEKVQIVTTQLKRLIIGFLKAQIVFSGLTFILTFLGLYILDVKYILVLTLLVVLVDLLPILGAGSFLVPWAVFGFINDNQTLGFGLIILFLVITIVRKIVEPKIYSTNFGISALAALISMYLGFKIMGILGLLLGPAIVVFYDSLTKAGLININFKSNKL